MTSSLDFHGAILRARARIPELATVGIKSRCCVKVSLSMLLVGRTLPCSTAQVLTTRRIPRPTSTPEFV